MLFPPLPLLALWLATSTTPTFAATAGSFADGGSTLVSAMMVSFLLPPPHTRSPHLLLQMFVGNEDKVYILDKAEGNAATVAGHPAWGAVW